MTQDHRAVSAPPSHSVGGAPTTGHAALDLVLSRRSVGGKQLAEPGPDDAQLQVMVEAALRAPDHAGLVPFRFAVVRAGARERLAQLFVQAARAAGKDEAGARLDAQRATRPPVSLAVIARLQPHHPDVPVHEQWACVGGAVTNVLNAAHALGFGAKMLSGAKARDAVVVQAFCTTGETLVGWIVMGTATGQVKTTSAKPPPEQLITLWG